MGEYASVNQLINPQNRLLPYLNENDAKGRRAAEINELIQLINALQNDEFLSVFPVNAQRTIWINSADSLPDTYAISNADRALLNTFSAKCALRHRATTL